MKLAKFQVGKECFRFSLLLVYCLSLPWRSCNFIWSSLCQSQLWTKIWSIMPWMRARQDCIYWLELFSQMYSRSHTRKSLYTIISLNIAIIPNFPTRRWILWRIKTAFIRASVLQWGPHRGGMEEEGGKDGEHWVWGQMGKVGRKHRSGGLFTLLLGFLPFWG